ncbi:MAG: hypothetical protein JWN04_5021 [Myxococcaceae bacterium]|nr:hypothetical protein [Myxococcaceae bacterium]
MIRTGVILTWETRDSKGLHVNVGSGVVLRTSGDVPFVLTAAHVARPFISNPCKLVLRASAGGGAVLDEGAFAWQHVDTGVDVAIVVPHRHGTLWPAMLEVSESLSIVEPSYERSHRDGDTYIVYGFPEDLMRIDIDEKEIGFTSFQWLCDQRNPPVKRPDDDILEFEWVKSGAQMMSADTGAALTHNAPDAARGMSGGPLWRHRDVVDPVTRMWTPQLACRIVAVEHEYRAGTRDVFCEPSERWSDWLIRKAAALDRNQALARDLASA